MIELVCLKDDFSRGEEGEGLKEGKEERGPKDERAISKREGTLFLSDTHTVRHNSDPLDL